MKVRENILISSIITILILGSPLIVSTIELDSGGGGDAPTHGNVTFDITKIHLWDDGDAIETGKIYFKILELSDWSFVSEVVGEYSSPSQGYTE